MDALFPLAIKLGPDGFWWMNLLFLVSIYTMLGLSLNLINGYAKMFSLGHHGFWAMGAYGAAWFTIHFQASMPGIPLFLASCVFAMFIAAVGGLIIGLPCLRLRGDYLAIATLGFGEIIRIAVQNSDPRVLGGSLGLEVPRVIMDVNRKSKGDFRVLMVLIGFVLAGLVAWAIRNYIKSAKGRAMLAVAQDETAAGLLGINPTRSKVVAFVAASAIAGLAGAVYAHYQGNITPLEFNFWEMVKIFLIVVLGGLGSISGCFFAAFLLIFVEQWLAKLPPEAGFFKDWWQVEYAAILVLLMIFRPRGIFGPRELPEVIRSTWAWIRGKRGTDAKGRPA